MVLECEQKGVVRKTFEIGESAVLLVEVHGSHALGLVPGMRFADVLPEDCCSTEEVEDHVELGAFLVDLVCFIQSWDMQDSVD